MAVALIDVSKETAESLEGGGPSGRSIWKRQQALRFTFGLASSLVLMLGFALGLRYWSPITTALARVRGGSSLFVIYLVLALLGGLAALLWATLAIVSLRRGLPKAPTTAEESILQFLLHCLPIETGLAAQGPAGEVAAEGYLLLLDGAKHEAKSFQEFKEYWAGVRATLLHDVRQRLQVKRVDSIRCWPHSEVKVTSQAGDFLIYDVIVMVKAYVSKAGVGGVREESVGMSYYRERVSVAKVGERWYLTSPYWTGEPTEADCAWPFPC